ncbi:MAG: hypothetical protein ACK5OS_02395 [Chryseotalea sp.]
MLSREAIGVGLSATSPPTHIPTHFGLSASIPHANNTDKQNQIDADRSVCTCADRSVCAVQHV